MTVPMYYTNSQYPSSFDNAQLSYPNDTSPSVSTTGFFWEDDRRSPAGMSGFQQGYMSTMRTTIDSRLDSPRYEPHMLPTAPMSTSAHIPRGLGYLPVSGSPASTASTDSEDCVEPTASAQWDNYNRTYNGRNLHDRHSRSNTSTPDYHSLSVQIPSFGHHQWAPLTIDSASTPYTPHDQSITLNGYVFPHTMQTPSPPPSYVNPLPISTVPSKNLSSRGRDANGVKKCSHCQATTTPLWRRDPSTFKPLCNACGLYLQQRNRLRPQVLIDADIDDGNTTDESDANYVGPECSHCRTHHTSVWRRSKTGAQLCNACGVYLRLRGKPRPLHLKKNKIKPRSKHPKD